VDLFAWAEHYVTSTSLTEKRTPPPRDLTIAADAATNSRPQARDLRPGRPSELVVETKAKKAKTKGALAHAARRAELFHRFFHHELQAAELMAWAILRFPEAPAPFLRGLRKVAEDEVRHANLYAEYVEHAGFAIGSFPVRDWFWERVPRAETPASFCAVMGLGFEAGNLDHTARFREDLLRADDQRALAIVDQVHEEEIPHVRFGLHWLRRFSVPAATGGDDDRDGLTAGANDELFNAFEEWRALLPAPLSPVLMKGTPLDRAARRRAGLGDRFMDALDAWTLSDR
jgi:uncharacterized ferritin-like protein (DUF455 family)